MSQKLVSHNDDIRRLVEKGYAVGFDCGYMIIRDIPYLDNQAQVQTATIVTKLEHIDQDHVKQDDHQIFFAGSVPHNIDGTPIANLADRSATLPLGETSSDVVVQRRFSNKPKATGEFKDFFDKVESYVAIISGPAMALHGATPYTYRTVEDALDDSVFKFRDTLTSRAEITDLSEKFKTDVVAVIGLGGTGSYLLDFLVKTPVREIRAFDLDRFHVHNAFRSPGKLDPDELSKTKAEVYGSRYENFRCGLRVEPKFIDSACGEDLEGVTFAFVCVDKGPARAAIFDLLIARAIPFIDVGVGLRRKEGALTGMARVTYFSAEGAQALRGKHLAEEAAQPDDLYRTTIQISELNAVNAGLAVMRFKQLRGFYLDEVSLCHMVLGVSDLKIYGETGFDAN